MNYWKKNKNMQNQINKLNTNVLSQKQTIQDLTLKINLRDQIIFKLKTVAKNMDKYRHLYLKKNIKKLFKNKFYIMGMEN